MELPADIWSFVSFIVKLFIYVTYFFPMLGARLLDYVGFWPTWWPFSPIID